MKRKLVLAVLVVALLGSAATASAQLRFDIDLMLPFSAGFVGKLSDLGGETTQFEEIPFTFLIPDFQALLQADLGLVKLGGGLRLFTVILQSVVFPTLFAEVKLGPVAVNASLGGIAYGFFGLFTDITTQNTLGIADLSAGFCVTDWFRINLGAFGFVPLQNIEGFVGVIYAGAKFTLVPGKTK